MNRSWRPFLGVALLALTIGAFAVLIGYSLLRIAAIERDMRIEATQNMLWVISQAQVAGYQLGAAGVERGLDEIDQSALEMRHNVFLSRLALLNDGPQRRRMEELGFAEALDELGVHLLEMGTLVENFTPADAPRLRALLQPYVILLDRAANKAMVAEWDALGSKLDTSREQLWQLIVSIAGTALAGAALCAHLLMATRDARRRARLLEKEKAFSELLIASSGEGIIAVDRECRCTVWNEASERLFRMPAEKTIGCRLSEVSGFFQIDSKVMEDIEEGGSKDETKRLRFILDTVGKAEWPGGKIPEDWSELVRKHNDKVASDDNDGSLKWINERIPPGRDVRCIVSVAMLAEGWDANTVTHIVGLRPFGSQLLCEQVVGRALRRKSYALDEETQMFAEETAKVFGVPFELIPFKVKPVGPQPPQPDPNHIYSVPEKAEYEITFPIVTGYHQSGQFDVHIDWSKVAKVTIDPMKIPQVVELTPLTTPDGTLATFGPGERPILSLKDWRARFRDQQVAFRLAREICDRWLSDNGAEAVPVQQLFPKVAFAAKRFLAEKLVCKGDSRPCDVLLVGEYMQAAIGSLLEAIKKGSTIGGGEVAIIPQGAAGRGSTLYVDFHTTKPIYPVTRCHLNAMVADTKKWEQSAAFLLDSHPGVKRWVKNDRLGFTIPYRHRGLLSRYIPDFIVVTDRDENVIVEIKGQVTDDADAKAKAAERWVEAVNRLGEHGMWRYVLVEDPGRLGIEINAFTEEKWDEGPFQLA